jgi:hypothetical protein
MKTIILFATLFSISYYRSFAQKDTLLGKKVWRTGINYKSYVLVDNNLFAINDSGKLVIWDLKKLDTIHFGYNSSSFKYTAISKDGNNSVFLGTNKGDIFKIIPKDLSYSPYLKIKYTIRFMCFNSLNKLFVIVPNAVYDPMTKQYWNNFENHTAGLVVTKKSFIFFHKKVTKYFSMPQYTFLDNRDRWWMTASYGEFGGDVEIFDTQSRAIVANKFRGVNVGLLFPKSVFEDDNGDTYMTSGLQHFGNSGEIYKIDKNGNATTIFDGVIYTDALKKRSAFDNGKDFVGPGAYNKIDKKIYFATSTGFYKAEITEDKIKPKFLFNTNLSWSREPMAIGVAMSILKLDFTTDNKLLFLTENDGFGIYDGKSLTMLK